MQQKLEFRSLVYHPYNIMMVLLLSGLSMLFVGLSGAYLYSRIQGQLVPLSVPFLFVFNTLILIASSISIHFANKAYRQDETIKYQQLLGITLLLSVSFLAMQYVAWTQMFQQNITLNSGNMAAYLYALSMLHFAHVFGGLPFLLTFLWTAHFRMKEPVSVLIYFSDPLKRLNLRLLTMYWHFLGVLWIYLVLFFWVNSLV